MKPGQIWKSKLGKDKFMVLSVGDLIAMLYPLQRMNHYGMRDMMEKHNGEVPIVLSDVPRFLEFLSSGDDNVVN